jgi:polyphosphate glucokinase
MDYKKVVTPKPANPENVVKSINALVKDYPPTIKYR